MSIFCVGWTYCNLSTRSKYIDYKGGSHMRTLHETHFYLTTSMVLGWPLSQPVAFLMIQPLCTAVQSRLAETAAGCSIGDLHIFEPQVVFFFSFCWPISIKIIKLYTHTLGQTNITMENQNF